MIRVLVAASFLSGCMAAEGYAPTYQPTYYRPPVYQPIDPGLFAGVMQPFEVPRQVNCWTPSPGSVTCY